MRALIVLGVVLALLLGCARGNSYSHTQITSSCVFRGGETGRVKIRIQDGVGAFVAYKNGELLGVEARDEIDTRSLPTRKVERWVDFPELEAWRRQLADAKALAAGDGDVTALVDALDGLPFDGLKGDYLSKWVRDDPARAARALDVASRTRLDDAWISESIRLALDADGLDDARLARWAEAAVKSGAREALVQLTEAPAAGPETLGTVLDGVDELGGSERAALWVSVGSRLLGDPPSEARVVATLDDLFGSDRQKAALALLADPRATPALARGFLKNIDDFFGSDRKDVYLACARALADQPDAHRLIHDQLDELFGSDREQAALRIIEDPDSPAELSAGFTRVIDDFFTSGRRKILEAILELPSYDGDEAIQRACLKATHTLYSSDRTAILKQIASDERTLPAVRKSAISRLGH